MLAYHVGKVDLAKKVLPMTAYKCAAQVQKQNLGLFFFRKQIKKKKGKVQF